MYSFEASQKDVCLIEFSILFHRIGYIRMPLQNYLEKGHSSPPSYYYYNYIMNSHEQYSVLIG